MNPTDAVKFKKGRDAARNALNQAVSKLAAEFELSQYEVLHAITDKAWNAAQERIDHYPDMYKATISNGLAETYHPHTLAQADAANQAAAVKPGPAKKKPAGKGSKIFKQSPWKWSLDEAEEKLADQSASMTNYMIQAKNSLKAGLNEPNPIYTAAVQASADAYYAKGPETVCLTATKNQGDWSDMPYAPKAVVGGTIAKSTVEQYGYQLPDGYYFKPTPWGGEFTIEKIDGPFKDQAGPYTALKNNQGVSVKVPMQTWMSVADLQELGIWDISIPPGYAWKSTDFATEDKWALVYAGQPAPAKPVDLDEHLAEYAEPAKKVAQNLDICGPKGCLHMFLYPGTKAEYTGQYLASCGIKFWQIEDALPAGWVATKYNQKDLVVIEFPEES